ncbi:FKBP-type peptidyl-prolyl cis-trans isomerase [Sphingobacterium sp. UT-1RO-CII-1]|uniref:FKBP-type peptidyl-prolyl cis-trans isomerase n=1 Tax=Sphingobacterium sp. UT-1RO-CII-1 TaxID=2995225 RepID=UPI003FA376BF
MFEQGAQVGSHFRIITPSIYAYGRSSNGKIPANSPLEFDIKVLKMENYKPDNSAK